jgi:NAD-dependent DNA ligase
MHTAKFRYIEYSFDRDGYISPVIHFFNPIKIEKQIIRKIPVTFSDLHQMPVNPGQSIVLVSDEKGNPHIVSVTGTPIVHIPVPSLCPCCKHPITVGVGLAPTQCTNPHCPEKFASKENVFENRTLEVLPMFGSLSALRYAASHTGAIVYRRNAHSRNAMIHWKANAQIDHTFYIAGLIHHS